MPNNDWEESTHPLEEPIGDEFSEKRQLALEAFANSYTLSQSKAEKFRKTAILGTTCVIYGNILGAAYIVALSSILLIVGSDTFRAYLGISEGNLLFSSIVLGFPFVLILGGWAIGFRMWRKAYDTGIDDLAWVSHQIASAIRNYQEQNFQRALKDLSNINIHSKALFFDLPLPFFGTPEAIANDTFYLLDKYIAALEESTDLQRDISNTFERVILPIISEMHAVDEAEITKQIESIFEPDSAFTYREIIRDALTPGPKWSGRIAKIIIAAAIAGFGLGAFFTIDETVGMIVTIILFSSYEVYRR